MLGLEVRDRCKLWTVGGQGFEVRGKRPGVWDWRKQCSVMLQTVWSSTGLCYRLYEAVLYYVTDCMKQYSVMLQIVWSSSLYVIQVRLDVIDSSLEKWPQTLNFNGPELFWVVFGLLNFVIVFCPALWFPLCSCWMCTAVLGQTTPASPLARVPLATWSLQRGSLKVSH